MDAPTERGTERDVCHRVQRVVVVTERLAHAVVERLQHGSRHASVNGTEASPASRARDGGRRQRHRPQTLRGRNRARPRHKRSRQVQRVEDASAEHGRTAQWRAEIPGGALAHIADHGQLALALQQEIQLVGGVLPIGRRQIDPKAGRLDALCGLLGRQPGPLPSPACCGEVGQHRAIGLQPGLSNRVAHLRAERGLEVLQREAVGSAIVVKVECHSVPSMLRSIASVSRRMRSIMAGLRSPPRRSSPVRGAPKTAGVTADRLSNVKETCCPSRITR